MSSDPFEAERNSRIASNPGDHALQRSAKDFLQESIRARYSYNFDWLGRPIIQYPQDMVAVQELIWRTRPDLIIETGIAHGGSLVLSASMLALLDYCDAAAADIPVEPRASGRRVIGIDIDIRAVNRRAIEKHPLAHKIELVHGSSVAPDLVELVRGRALGQQRVMVMLDSNHTADHVFEELRAYAPLVSTGCYCVVFDTVVEDLPKETFQDRPWSPGNSPAVAVTRYLEWIRSQRALAADGAPLDFVVDSEIDNKLCFSVAPGGYLRRIEAVGSPAGTSR